MRAVILLGAPGSGKGTAAEDVSVASGFIHLSTGDMLREYIQNEHPVGVEANSYIKRGQLVPDELIIRLVEDRLSHGPAEACYLFDGFPRTAVQARELDEMLLRQRGRVTHAVQLEVSKETVLRRIAGRRVCRHCCAVYNVKTKQPEVDGVCNICGGEVYQRSDDNEETVLKRLEVYQVQNKEIAEYYRERGLYFPVDAEDRKETELALLALLNSDVTAHD